MLNMVLAAALAASVATADQREELSLTIYNQNFGLVREVREVELGKGEVVLEFADVASTIQPETVAIRALGGGISVLEQNYLYDLLSPQKLLEKYVGREVTVYRRNETTGRDESQRATVLAVNGGTILRIGDEITFNYPGRIAFPEIPENLIAKPTLRWLLSSERARQKVEVSYLAHQLSWKSDYVMVIDDTQSAASLHGWVTLTNQSGATYENTRLKLVAGDVQRVGDRAGYGGLVARMRAVEEADAKFREEGFFEYHLYTLPRKTTLRQNEQKQISLLEAEHAGVHKRMVLASQPHWFVSAMPQPLRNQKVSVYLEVPNTRANGLGMALPAGVVRVYQADSEGSQQFIGEDRIDHTPRDETLRIKTGEAFDVVADRKQTDFQILGHCTNESAWEISLRNHKDVAETVEVQEHTAGDWTIVSSSHKAHKDEAHRFHFSVPVPANGEAVIRYRLRTRWC
jgi:hypothetical protein